MDTPTIKRVAEHLTRRLRLWVQFPAPSMMIISTTGMTVGEVLDFLSRSFLDSFLSPKSFLVRTFGIRRLGEEKMSKSVFQQSNFFQTAAHLRLSPEP